MSARKQRLAIFGSHPIPYRAPLYRRLAQRDDLDLLVMYGDDYGVRPRRSRWGVEDFLWSGGVVDGYPHVFLKNIAPKPDPSAFWGKINPGLVAELRRFGPDAAMVMGYRGAYALQAIAACKALGIRLLYLSEDSERAPMAGVRGLGKEQWLKRLYAQVDGFLAIGERNRAHYRSLGVRDDQLFHFPYAVDNDYFRARREGVLPSREAIRASWGIAPDRTCVIFSGRLVAVKNVAELVRAAAPLSHVHLLIVGNGPDRSDLESLAKSLVPGRATFAGFLNQDQLPSAYVAADVFALPSSFEPWGLVCNEALNFGLPIVVSDRVGAGPDLALAARTGWIYPLGDIGAFTERLRDASSAVALRRGEVSAEAMRVVDGFGFGAQQDGLLAALRAPATKRLSRVS